jgi:hypothetical protein
MPKPRPKRSGSGPKPGRPKATSAPNWEDELVSRFRRLIHEADPAAVEEQKWKKPSNPEGVPVWSHDGIVCVVGVLKNRVRLTFANGAPLQDPKGLFNACLVGNAMRAIDVREGEAMDEAGIKALLRAAVAQNVAAAKDRLRSR